MNRPWLIAFGVLILVVGTASVTRLVTTPLDVQPNAAPWWAIPVFTLIGSILGLVLTPLVTYWTSNRTRELDAVQELKAQSEQVVIEFLDLAERYVIRCWKQTDVEEAPLYAANTKVTIRCSVDATKAAQDVLREIEKFENQLEKLTGIRSQEGYWPAAKGFREAYWKLVNVLRNEGAQEPLPTHVTQQSGD